MKTDIAGGASRRVRPVLLPIRCPIGWPVKEPVRMPVYSSVERYDPVLRAHCGLDAEACVFPSLPDRRPDSVV